MQRGTTHVVETLRVRPRFQQESDVAELPILGGDHEGRLTPAVRRVDRRARVQLSLQIPGMVLGGRIVQGGFSIWFRIGGSRPPEIHARHRFVAIGEHDRFLVFGTEVDLDSIRAQRQPADVIAAVPVGDVAISALDLVAHPGAHHRHMRNRRAGFNPHRAAQGTHGLGFRHGTRRPVRAKQLSQLRAAFPHGDVQRGAAGPVGRVQLRPGRDQLRGDFHVAPLAGQMQDGLAVRVRRVHVGAGIQQRLDRLRASVFRGDHQGGLSERIGAVGIGPGFQHFRDVRRIHLEVKPERDIDRRGARAPEHRVRGGEIRFCQRGRQQDPGRGKQPDVVLAGLQPDKRKSAVGTRERQGIQHFRFFTGRASQGNARQRPVLLVQQDAADAPRRRRHYVAGLGSLFQQVCDNLRPFPLGGMVDRRQAIFVFRIQIGARLHQDTYAFELAPAGQTHERGASIAVRTVDIRSVVQQRLKFIRRVRRERISKQFLRVDDSGGNAQRRHLLQGRFRRQLDPPGRVGRHLRNVEVPGADFQ